MSTPQEIPAFLQRQEPLARFAWWSDRRFQIIKGCSEVVLTPDDMVALRNYVATFEGDTNHG